MRVLIIIVIFILLTNQQAASQKKVELSVLMYPWVPDYTHIAKVIKTNFEAQNPEVKLKIAKQNWGYYKPSGLQKKYDIYELDTIYLADFVKNNRLQPINSKEFLHIEKSFNFSKSASENNGVLYGSPHWICGLFIFYHKHDLRMKQSINMPAFYETIQPKHQMGRGLLIDLNGTMTLAEKYIDCLFDMGYTQEEVISQLRQKKLNKKAVTNLNKLLKLCDPGIGRSILAHEAWPPYYALEFAHARGRALVGYSERMFHILQEIRKPTDFSPVVDSSKITLRLFNQGNKSPRPFYWVDSFTVDKSVNGKKLKYAKKFLTFMSKTDIYIKTLLSNGICQYILPAYPKVFDNKKLLSYAPLYKKFKTEIQSQKGNILVKKELYPLLKYAGEQLNRQLDLNLRPKDR